MSLVGLLASLPNPLVCDADAETATVYVSLGTDYEFIIDEAVFNVGSCNTADDIELIATDGTPSKNVALEPLAGNGEYRVIMKKGCFSGDQVNWGTKLWQESASPSDTLSLGVTHSSDSTGIMIGNTALTFSCKFIDSYVVGATLGTASQAPETLTAASTVTDLTFSMAFNKQSDDQAVTGTVASGTPVYALVTPDDLYDSSTNDDGVFHWGTDGWVYIPTKCQFGVFNGALDTASIDWTKKVDMFEYDSSSPVYWPAGSATLRDYMEFGVTFDSTSKGYKIQFDSFVFVGQASSDYSMICELELCLEENPVACNNWGNMVKSAVQSETRDGVAFASWDLTGAGV